MNYKELYFVCKITYIQNLGGFSMDFGEYISQKRKEKKLTIRELASKLNISFTYLSDVEKGRAKAFKSDILKLIIEILQLDDDEQDKLNDLAGKSQNKVAPDIAEFFEKHPEAVAKFRKSFMRNDENE